MSNDTAAAAPRSLFPNASRTAAPATAPRTQGATTATDPSTRPPLRTAASPVAAPESAPRIAPATRVEAVRPVAESAPTRVPAPTSSHHVAPMYSELKRPLNELVERRGKDDFSQTFVDLVRHGVSDVHMTRSRVDETFTVEARVDGKKQIVHDYAGVEAKTIANKIKTDASMTTDQNLVPEDGNYPMVIDGQPYRARAVALPRHDGGERIVFRLPQTGRIRSLDELGFTQTNLEATKRCLDTPGGMTLIVGPTGEGKTAAAHSSLMYMLEKDNGVIITLEDPVERVIPGITQIEVNEDVPGAGFSDFMKYVVRADPNVLFIGEIRDRATATAAVEIAKSGIRVIATLHATDNVAAFQRLIGMADHDPLAVLDSINGIISQRLVPRLVQGTDRFSGRYPVNEVTINSEALTDALVANTSKTAIRLAAAPTSTTFKENVEELVANGITTLVEARKVVRNV